MKKIASSLAIAILGGIIALGGYLFFIEGNQNDLALIETLQPTNTVRTSFAPKNEVSPTPNFTEAAQKTIDAVVHVMNVDLVRFPRNYIERYYGGGITRKRLRGSGSGVIITPDGYIVTNFHVVKGASEIRVILNDNKIYKAQIVGTDPETDIALLKINEDELPYITFADSDFVKVGQWALAVGNPFNLTSTVTAGIISATSRDLNRNDRDYQSFIQTDAAINPGNSGGALVNTEGQLIGINTAITSQTGSYIGYSFAIPSNTVQKIVEDILEYGHVKEAVLGVRGAILNNEISQKLDLTTTQGFYIADIENKSGAKKSGLKKGDVILKIDRTKITKFSDLTGYMNTKRPGEIVAVTYLRNGEQHQTKVTLIAYKIKTYSIEEIGLEVTNASAEELAKCQVQNGVKISKALNHTMKAENLVGIIITAINKQKISNVNDVKTAIRNANPRHPLSITFAAPNGNKRTFVFR